MDQELKTKYTADMSEWDAAIAKAKADLSMLDGYLRKAAQAHRLSATATKTDATAQTQLVEALNSVGRKISENNALIAKNTSVTKANSSEVEKAGKVTDQAGVSLASYAKGYLSIAAVMGAGKVFLDATKDVTKYENQLKVASGTQEDYAKNTQFLEQLASKYNKNVIDLGSNFAKLTIATRGTNLEGAQTERLFAAVTATSSALQMSVDDTNWTFNAFIQMVSKGNVQAEELRGQLGERLFGAFNLVAKSMGKTTAELNKMLELGEVTANEMLPRFTVELENTFGKDAEKNARNLGSGIEYATGQITLFIAETGRTSGFTEFLTQAAQDVGNLTSKLILLNREKGIKAAIGGASGAFLETLTGGAYQSTALQYARDQQSNHGYTPLIGRSLQLPGEIRSNYPFMGSSEIPNQANPEAAEKAKKAAEAKAKKADAALNKWVAEQIQASKDRIAEAFLTIAQQNQPDYNSHSDPLNSVGAIGQADKRGISTGYKEFGSFEMSSTFSSDVSSSAKALEKLGHVIQQMNSVKPIGWEEKLDADALKAQNNILAEESLRTEEVANKLGSDISSALRNAAAASMESMGKLVAGFAMGTADWSDVGNAFLGIMATFFDQMGQALASAAALFLIGEISIKSMNPIAAAAGAVLSFAAAEVARSQMSGASDNAFWTGGFVKSQGVDSVPAMLSPGEMVLTQSHQSNLMSFLDGAHSASGFGAANYGNSRSDKIQVEVVGRIRSGDVALSNARGTKKNKYFE